MTIQEAIKSGKNFKRSHWGVYMWPGGNGEFKTVTGWCDILRAEDLLADDWEIEEEKVTITREQLENALRVADYTSTSSHVFPPSPTTFASRVAKALGFK